jgi:DNA-binding transcriptional MerR regulator
MILVQEIPGDTSSLFSEQGYCKSQSPVLEYEQRSNNNVVVDNRDMETLSTGLVRRITGATARQLDYWSWSGFLEPSSVTGNKRHYSFEDVVRIMAVMRLKEAGLSLQAIRKAIDKLKQYHQDPLRELKLVVYLNDVYVYHSAEDAYRAVDGQSTYLFMDLGKVAEQTEALLKSLR